MTVMSKIKDGSCAHSALLGVTGVANVRTPCGPRRIENVRPGDLIVTRDNGLQPVRMVWTRSVTASDIAADPSVAPVCLKARAIGPMMPQKDLLVAASHRVLVPGYRLADFPDDRSCLIAARDIVEASDETYFDRAVAEMKFYNIVFAEHQVFAANGLPVESYLPSPVTLAQLDETTSQNIAALFSEEAESTPDYPSSRYAEHDWADFRPEFV